MHFAHHTGAASELKAAAWFIEHGCQVYFPVIQQGAIDFVVEDTSGGLCKIQVKTATWNISGNNRYLQVRTTSTNKQKVKPSDRVYDLLVVIHEDCVWVIPAEEVHSSNLSMKNWSNYLEKGAH